MSFRKEHEVPAGSGLPRSTVQYLLDAGHEAEHAGDLGLSRASDETIIEEAVSRNSVIVTLDSDFHALLALSNAALPSVIRIRLQGLKGDAVAGIIQQVAEVAEDDLSTGAAISVTERRVAVRRLPLIDSDA